MTGWSLMCPEYGCGLRTHVTWGLEECARFTGRCRRAERVGSEWRDTVSMLMRWRLATMVPWPTCQHRMQYCTEKSSRCVGDGPVSLAPDEGRAAAVLPHTSQQLHFSKKNFKKALSTSKMCFSFPTSRPEIDLHKMQFSKALLLRKNA